MDPIENEDTVQFFKEERVEDGVYNVYLKKVRYHTPDVGIPVPIHPPDGSNSLFYCNIAANEGNDRGTIKQWSLEEVRMLKCGSLDRLVENLSSDSGELDSTYVNIFLATYRSFASPKQVLNLIFERYKTVATNRKMKQSLKQHHLKTLKTVISVWLDTYPEDFDEPPNFPCLSSLQTFTHSHMRSTHLEQRVQVCLDNFRGTTEQLSAPILVEDASSQLCERLLQLDIGYSEAPGYLFKFTDFESIPERVFAEQLTYIDSELFKKVVPHQCLGSVWSQRDKKKNKAPSVMATVEQFNNVSHRVVATVLKRPDLATEERVKVLEKWIDIAQELRILKNFSSLKAIVSGLQSNSIYRLKKVWAEVSKERMELFEEHSDIFSEENNQIMSRELLVKEGTAKFADPDSTATIRGHKRKGSGWTGTLGRRKSTYFEVTQTVQGTVPYLGTFLTDLVMLDTACPNTTEDGLINFDKKRKEFEILAQIRLLQSSAQMYTIKPDRGFFEWFFSVRTYDDNESYELSCEIEPFVPTTPVKGHRKRPSLGFFSPKNLLGITTPSSAQTDDSLSELTQSSPSQTDITADAETKSLYSNPECELTPISGSRPNLRHSVSVGALSQLSDDASMSPWRSPESVVVKVFMEGTQAHLSNHYKCILLGNSDHTKTVISNILLKFNIDNLPPDDFAIFQQLPQSELQIPDKGNVFYAIKQDVSELKFVMRRKSELEKLKNRHLKGKGKRKKYQV